jgi:hypothetical protein
MYTSATSNSTSSNNKSMIHTSKCSEMNKSSAPATACINPYLSTTSASPVLVTPAPNYNSKKKRRAEKQGEHDKEVKFLYSRLVVAAPSLVLSSKSPETPMDLYSRKEHSGALVRSAAKVPVPRHGGFPRGDMPLVSIKHTGIVGPRQASLTQLEFIKKQKRNRRIEDTSTSWRIRVCSQRIWIQKRRRRRCA